MLGQVKLGSLLHTLSRVKFGLPWVESSRVLGQVDLGSGWVNSS